MQRFYSPHANLWLMGGPRGTVRFEGGTYATDDPDEIAWLKSHPSYGQDFFPGDLPPKPAAAPQPSAAQEPAAARRGAYRTRG